MKHLLLISMMLLGSHSFALQASDIEGYWELPINENNKVSVAQIYQKNGKFYAVGFAYTDKTASTETDSKNPNSALQSRPLKETPIINGIMIKNGKLEDGEIYNPSAGKHYYLKGELAKDKKSIKWKASIDKAGIFGPTLIWKKVANPAEYASFAHTPAKLQAIAPTNQQLKH